MNTELTSFIQGGRQGTENRVDQEQANGKPGHDLLNVEKPPRSVSHKFCTKVGSFTPGCVVVW
jgi:hypothetical protein